LLTSLVTLLIVVVKAGRIRIHLNRKFCLVFLKKSYPYALLILLMAFYNRIDSVMLERLLPDPVGKEQAGIYAQAFRLLDAVSMFGALVAGLLLPMFSRMIKEREQVGPMVKLSFTLLFVPAIIIAFSSLFYDHEIMALLYHSHIETSADILGLLMIGFTGIAVTYIFGTLLTANGSIRQLNLMAFAGMLLNITLNLLLIPAYQAYGSAVASLVTQLATGLAQFIIAAIIFRLRPGATFILRLLSFVLLTALLAWLSRWFDNRAAGYFGMIGASVLAAFLVRLISIRDLFRIIVREP
ncbi:MAG TPA: polysaccharide biosynthesis C-terminal domain-containing protein, partial [Prolixibacteraceae bacterium]|nr:polysaccharide biosynthesis C-terminal domain-containing protein [Prolixibacteraceae bacterium]